MAYKLVSRVEFHSTLNVDKRDIMPTIVSTWCRETGYTSEWRASGVGRELFGKSDDAEGGRYWLVEPS